MRTLEGQLTTSGEKFFIVVSRFNEFISSKLLSGALDELKRHGIEDNNIDIAWVPGAFEIPLVAKKAAKTGKYNAVIALGAVIKGSTSHYDYVCAEVSKGVASVSLETEVPVLFGVLTTDNLEQAIERAGTKSGNKGADAAKSAIEMANLIIDVSVAYESDIEKVKKVLDKLCEQIKDEYKLKEVTCLGIQELADSSIKFRLVANTNYSEQFTLDRNIKREIVKIFAKNNITIPYNQVVVHNG